MTDKESKEALKGFVVEMYCYRGDSAPCFRNRECRDKDSGGLDRVCTVLQSLVARS